ncbi:DUF6681 family protein [Liquorilactobacillus mali]|uniref:DUF6681 family protein n=1 Tax=Liquorilactobacillus mali TaxID=1618 RepID=UPI0023502EAC|nr:DUF6681 family protein [Liquorilactobacillus mali]MDC7953504.1 hypothetical protein [Liquorilactobacillus mali]
MFSIIGIINSYLGYININVKLKNRIYTILGTVGNFYLLYVAYQFFKNGFMTRGALFILAFIALAYFSYLNVIHYFTKKQSRIDFSPWIEKKLHMKPREEKIEKNSNLSKAGYVQTNGIFDNEKMLPASLKMNQEHHNNLKKIVEVLEQQGYLSLNFGGLSEEQQLKVARTNTNGIDALLEPVALPYFELEKRGDKFVILGGVNPLERKELGEIVRVGLTPVSDIGDKYEIFLAAVVIEGGPHKFAGRSSLVSEEQPFNLGVQVAYNNK